MRFVCESCRAQYMINDEKVGPKGVKVRCRKCGYVILVKRGGEAQAKNPVASAGADPDDALATQILQSPLSSPAPAEVTRNLSADTMSDLTNPGIPESRMQGGDSSNSLLGDAGDDEIGAVFDQVLNSGAHSIPKDGLGVSEDRRTETHSAVKEGVGLGDDNDDRMSTRVLDAEVVRKLAEETGDRPAKGSEWDTKTEKNGHASETEVPQNDWFVAIDEKQTGPLSLEKVKEHWDRGEIGPDSLCWRAGFTDWVPLSDVAQLASVLAPRPASKPIVMNAPTGPAVVSVPVESAFSAGGMMKSVRSEVQVPMAASAKPEETGSWRPSTSLGSLVQDEMAALSRPAPRLADEPPGPSEVSVNGLLDLPPPDSDEKPHTNGRTNGAAADSLPQARSSRPPAPPAPANPYVATPGATYSSPGITQYRPDKDRGNQMMWVAVGLGGLLVVTLLGLVIWLVNRQPTQIVQPVPAQPPPLMVAQAQPVPQPVPAPVAVQPAPVAAPASVAAPAPAAVEPTPSGPLPPGFKPQSGTAVKNTGSGGGSTKTTGVGGGTKVAPATPAREPVEKPAPPEKKSAGSSKSDDDEFNNAFGSSEKETPKTGAENKKKTGPYIPPAPGSASTDVKETLGQADVFEVVSSNKPALAKCVEDQRKKEPGVSGKLVMKWNIQTSGKTSNISVQSEEFKATYMAACVGGLIKAWTFPKHKVAGDPILFPFKF